MKPESHRLSPEGLTLTLTLVVITALCLAGCETTSSNQPKKPRPSEWVTDPKGRTAAQPPPRLNSPIAPVANGLAVR